MKKLGRKSLGKQNYILLVLSIVIITIAYFIMALGDVTVSPILLVVSYVILIPASLLIPIKKNDKDK
jgi:hypothetical protein